jgi:hypothetical protein
VVYSRVGVNCVCPPNLPYYDNSPTQTDCQPCISHACATCASGSSCSSCVSSTPSRTGSLCLCPSGKEF